MRFHIGVLLALLALLCGLPQLVIADAAKFSTGDIQFSNDGVSLFGTLFRPEHPYAAVVLMHGSGQEKRMRKFAERLANEGIAVLTYDKRGVGQSGGVYVGPEVGTNNLDASNLKMLASDANAAVDTLTEQLSSEHLPIGLMGFSQAGWVIPIAAERNHDVSFIVLFSGPVLTTLEQLRFQFLTEGKQDFWNTHSEADVRKHLADDPDRYQFADTDPRASLNKLSIPGLWLFGGKDVQAPYFVSTERLDALKSQGKSFEYKLFPELGHNITFAGSNEAIASAVQWVKSLSSLHAEM